VLEREDVYSVPAANVLTEPATSAFLLVHRRDAEEIVDPVGVLEAEGVERADVDAQLAPRADALLIDDDGLSERQTSPNVSRIASGGQTSPHAPQSMHRVGSMTCSSLRSPVMAFVGQRFVQAVQPMHVSMIL
jgi:hypothetical protein